MTKKENSIIKWINIKSIITLVVLGVLTWTATNLFAVKTNTKTNELQDKQICEAKEERKELKKADNDQKEDIQSLVVAVTELVGELKVTNERLNNLKK